MPQKERERFWHLLQSEMSSRLSLGLHSAPCFFRLGFYCLLLTGCCLLLTVYCLSETVDYIVAVVNEEVITLTDLKIAEAFGLYEEEVKTREESPRLTILQKLIDQKLVIQLSSEKMSIESEELDSFLSKLAEKMGDDEVQKRLEEFGLNEDDLRECIREKILYQKNISEKFNQSVIISLKEIETYYRENYVPAKREKGIGPEPMMDILGWIESTIRQDKIKKQAEDWLNNLRRQADIQIRIKS